jgi:hypothetical protein
MAHIAHQLGPVCLEGGVDSGVSRWLVGVVGLGGGAAPAQRPQAVRGALLQFACLRKTRGAQAFGSCSRRLCAGWLSYVPCSRGGGGRRRKAVALPQPTGLAGTFARSLR